MGMTFLRQSAGLKAEEISLLALVLADAPNAAAIDGLFNHFDVDALRQEQTSLLSLLCVKAGYVGVPESQRARMKGFSRYMAVRNARQIMHFLDLARKYAEAEIPVLLCKGVALRLGYMVDQTRHMWDVDVAVPPECHARAVDIARKAGWRCQFSMHAASLEKEPGMPIDVHVVFHKNSVNGVDETRVWRRARAITARSGAAAALRRRHADTDSDERIFQPCY